MTLTSDSVCLGNPRPSFTGSQTFSLHCGVPSPVRALWGNYQETLDVHALVGEPRCPPVYLPRKKQSSWMAQEGPWELQAGQDQAKPETDLGWPPSRLPVTPEGLQQPGAGTEHQLERPPTPSPVEDLPPGSCQGTPQVTQPEGMGRLPCWDASALPFPCTCASSFCAPGAAKAPSCPWDTPGACTGSV